MAQTQAPQPNKVMISYNWGSQPFAKDICAKLTEEGYNVWMDVQTGADDGMKKDIITGMTDGLTKACCIVVILSQKYEESQNCCTELKGAYVRRIPMIFLKEPSHKVNGETLTIMGTALYHEYDVDPADNKVKVKNLPVFLNDVALRCPIGSPARSRPKKRILVVGCSGVGKSSLVSLLINNVANEGLNPHEIYVSSSPVPGTWDATEYENDKYIVVDTMGVGLSEKDINPFGNELALKKLKNFMVNSRKGYHFIFLVLKFNKRSLQSQIKAYKMFYQALFPDMHKRFVIILTHCPAALDDDSRESLEGYVPGISEKINVDIPPANNPNPNFVSRVLDKQKEAKDKIDAFLAKHEGIKPQVPEASMIERSRFYYFVRELLNLLGYKWDDNMEKLLISMGMSEQDRDAARLII